MAALPSSPPPAPLLPSLHVLGPVNPPNTLELYIDFVCPRSRALFRGSIMGPSRNMDGAEVSDSSGALAILANSDARFKVVVRPFVQGAHLGSKVTHEVALAVLTVAPTLYWSFCNAVFEAQLTAQNYFDERVDNMTPRDLRTELITTAIGLLPQNDQTTVISQRIRSLLCSPKSCPGRDAVEVPDSQAPDPTAGTIRICESLKQVVQKSYLNPASAPGVALWNGVPIPEFSPNWGQLEWSTFLMSRLA